MPLFKKIAHNKLRHKIRSIAVSHRFNLIAIVPELENLNIVSLYRFSEGSNLKLVWQLDSPTESQLPRSKQVDQIKDISWRPDSCALSILYTLKNKSENDEPDMSELRDLSQDAIFTDNSNGLIRLVSLESGADILNSCCVAGESIDWVHVEPAANTSYFTSKIDMNQYFEQENDYARVYACGGKNGLENMLDYRSHFSKFGENEDGLDESNQEILDEISKKNKSFTAMKNYLKPFHFTIVQNNESCNLYAYGLNQMAEIKLPNKQESKVTEKIFKPRIQITNLPESFILNPNSKLTSGFKIYINETHACSISAEYLKRLNSWHEPLLNFNLNFRSLFTSIQHVEQVYEEQLLQIKNTELKIKLKKSKCENLIDLFLTNQSSPEVKLLFQESFTIAKITALHQLYSKSTQTIQKLLMSSVMSCCDSVLGDIQKLTGILEFETVSDIVCSGNDISDNIEIKDLNSMVECITKFMQEMLDLVDKLHKETQKFGKFCKWLYQKRKELNTEITTDNAEPLSPEILELGISELTTEDENDVYEYIEHELYQEHNGTILLHNKLIEEIRVKFHFLVDKSVVKLEMKKCSPSALKALEVTKVYEVSENKKNKSVEICRLEDGSRKLLTSDLGTRVIAQFSEKQPAPFVGIVLQREGQQSSDLMVLDLEDFEDSDEDSS